MTTVTTSSPGHTYKYGGMPAIMGNMLMSAIEPPVRTRAKGLDGIDGN